MADRTYRSPGNPWNCTSCGHLPAMHEDGKGGLGPCHGRPASERRWWRRRGCDCAGYVPQWAEPHVHPYVRDPNSGAGNCRCGRAERHVQHPHEARYALGEDRCTCGRPMHVHPLREWATSA